jgi:hypothetical protein
VHLIGTDIEMGLKQISRQLEYDDGKPS